MSGRVEEPPRNSPLSWWWGLNPPLLDTPLLNRGPGTKEEWAEEIACKSSFGVDFQNKWGKNEVWTQFFKEKVYPRVVEKLIEKIDLEEVSAGDWVRGKMYSIERDTRVKDFDEDVTWWVKDVKKELWSEGAAP
jgi:hypothetical protein